MPGQEYHRQYAVQVVEVILQIEPGEPGHTYIEQYTAVLAAHGLAEECIAGFVQYDLVAGGAQQSGNGGAERRVVVDYVDERRRGHMTCAVASGIVKRKTAPPSARFSAQIFPP